eukprot:m.357619 g.357619  ORF g.357619 m.357619 type:complete len:528 (+) comp17887_c0_seq1:416-1999(+)
MSDDEMMFETDDEEEVCFDSDSEIEEDDDLGEFDSAEAVVASDVKILTEADLLSTMFSAIEAVNSVFEIPAGTARQLLIYANWNSERLLERYYGGDRDALFEEAQCVNPEQAVDTAEEKCCIICDEPVETYAAMPCGHISCDECWAQYLFQEITELGHESISCPAGDCAVLVDEYTVIKLLERAMDAGEETDGLISKFKYLAAKSYVRSNPHLRWCPNPKGCGLALSVSHRTSDRGLPRMLKCSCEYEFCFVCGMEDHYPLGCEMYAKWLKKCQDDSETANWIAANTQECPKCRFTIEKNGGCNHMTCRQCKHEFCWMCLGDWEPHGSSWFKCNRFEEGDSVAARSKQDESRSALKRYLFYSNRYANHGMSLRLEDKLKELADEKQKQMEEQGASWIDGQFMYDGIKALHEARRIMMMTYVFAFNLERTNQSEIFESNQSNLEHAVEKLSRCLEGEAQEADADMQAMKLKVMDLSQFCLKRKDVLIEHILQGYDKDLWVYKFSDIGLASHPPTGPKTPKGAASAASS